MSTLVWIIVICALILVSVGGLAFRSWRSNSRSTSPSGRTIGAIDGLGFFECEVVGESRYQSALSDICGGKCRDGWELKKRALLALEDDNPHDPRAVRIDIDGRTVGYLSRRFAKGYRDRLELQKLPPGNFTCPALIVGGWDRGGGDEGHFGVKLDLPVEH